MSLRKRLVALPRVTKMALASSLDFVLCVFAVWVAFSLRYETWHVPYDQQWAAYLIAPALALPLFYAFGFYREMMRHTGIATMQRVIAGVFVFAAIYATMLFLLRFPGVPRTVGLLQPMLLLLLIGISRGLVRHWLLGGIRLKRAKDNVPRLMIYGAGDAGASIAKDLASNRDFVLVGFLDNDRSLQGSTINGLRVYPPERLPALINAKGVTDVLLAMPALNRARRHEIIETLRPQPVKVRTLPALSEIAGGAVHVSDIRELDIEDLLGRDPVRPDRELIGHAIEGKTVLVTGAGGSIGSELCRQILTAQPRILLLLDHNEFGLYSIHHNLCELKKEHSPNTQLVPLLRSIRDLTSIGEVCTSWRPDTVYHAAAYKHVPMVEHNPAEGLKNNTFGTLTTARAAIMAGVKDFILISTDKAVRPTNIMGASKRLAELVLQALAFCPEPAFWDQTGDSVSVRNRTRFSMVRFGNVLGSSGSVVPLFRRQIRDGGPVTVTDPEVVRYFMTIPEAAQLVIQAGAMASGGDVFLLDMGEPVKIVDLARRMIELSGRTVLDGDNPDGDIELAFIGLRPGEKLYEELLIDAAAEHTAHPLIMKAHEESLDWERLREALKTLSAATDRGDFAEIYRLVQTLVSGFRPDLDAREADWDQLQAERRQQTDPLRNTVH